MNRIFSRRWNGFLIILLSPLLLPLGLAYLGVGLVFPLISREAVGRFAGWRMLDDDCADHYFAPCVEFVDKSGRAHEFVSGEGVYGAEPPAWDENQPLAVRYLAFAPDYADLKGRNPFYSVGALLVVMSAPLWSVCAAMFLLYFIADYMVAVARTFVGRASDVSSALPDLFAGHFSASPKKIF